MKKRWVPLMCVLFFVTTLAFGRATRTNTTGTITRPANAHNSVVRVSPTGRIHTRASIDGSQHPELIPDSLAYHCFLLAVADQAHLDGDQRRLNGYFKHLGFSSASNSSAAALIAIAEQYQTGLDRLRTERDMTADTDPQAQFLSDKDRLVRESIANVARALRPDHAAMVDAYVMDQVRKSIKITP